MIASVTTLGQNRCQFLSFDVISLKVWQICSYIDINYPISFYPVSCVLEPSISLRHCCVSLLSTLESLTFKLIHNKKPRAIYNQSLIHNKSLEQYLILCVDNIFHCNFFK